MNTIFVLIIVISGGTTQSGWTTVQQEFSTEEKCNFARIHIVDSVPKGVPYQPIRSQGCYKK